MTFADVLTGEILKARTHRALVATVAAAITITLGFCFLDASPDLGFGTPEAAGVYTMANFSFFAAVVGVLLTSSEYGGNQLTTSALAVPHRKRILAAKLILSAFLTTGLGLLAAVFIATIEQAPLGIRSVYATRTSGTLLLSLALAVASWTAIGLISTCLAVVIRSQTAALATMIVLSFGGTPLMMAVPIFQYLPTNAGVLMFIDRKTQTSDWLNPPDVTPTTAGITLAAWCVAAILTATLVIDHRDIGSGKGSLE